MTFCDVCDTVVCSVDVLCSSVQRLRCAVCTSFRKLKWAIVSSSRAKLKLLLCATIVVLVELLWVFSYLFHSWKWTFLFCFGFGHDIDMKMGKIWFMIFFKLSSYDHILTFKAGKVCQIWYDCVMHDRSNQEFHKKTSEKMRISFFFFFWQR